MYPERLMSNPRSRSSNSDHSFFNNQPTNSLLSKNETERLTKQIDLVLEEQKEFLKELNLTVCDEDGFRVEENQITAHFGSNGDALSFDYKNTYNIKKDKSPGKASKDKEIVVSKPVFFASGDRKVSPKLEEDSRGILRRAANNKTRPAKPRVFFTEEPVKLPKTTYDTSSADILRNKDHEDVKSMSVKMLFFPAGELSASNSSIGSEEDTIPLQTTSSMYMTASNSNEDIVPKDSDEVIDSVSDSSGGLSIQASTSHSRDRLTRWKE